MSVKLPGSETWSFHGISCLPLNFKDDFCSLLLTFKLGRLNKLTGNELFARNHKILSSNLLMIPQTTRKRILNFWFPKNRGEDSGFLTPKQHWRFRISDHQTTQERIQNFRSPKQDRRGYRISDSLNKNTIQEGFQYFRTPKNIVVESEFLITQTTWKTYFGRRLAPKVTKNSTLAAAK